MAHLLHYFFPNGHLFPSNMNYEHLGISINPARTEVVA